MKLYLTGVRIINFQSIDNLYVSFCEGTNGLVGPSNSGKSAFLRAIDWNLRNLPAGGDFIRIGTNEASVTTYFSDGHAIERTRNRSGSKNLYILYKDGKVVEEYTGFGQKVPEAILEVTKAGSDFLFYFSKQMEGPFLLSDTPKVRAERIGNLEELGKIDLAVGNINDDINLTKKEQKNLQKELGDVKQKIAEDELALQEKKDKVEFLTILKESILEKQNIVNSLEKSKEKVQRFENEIKMIHHDLEKSKRITKAWNDELPNNIDRFKRLQNAATRLEIIERELSSIQMMDKAKLERLEQLTDFITNMRLTYRTLEGLYNRIEQNERETNRIKSTFKPKVSSLDLSDIDLKIESFTMLFKYNKRLKEIETTQAAVHEDIAQSKTRTEELLNEFVELLANEKVCPTCYQTTEHVSKEAITNNI